MPNFAAAIKEEIRRLARREIKATTSSTKGAVAQFRREIASLKRLAKEQQREIAFLKAQEQKRIVQPQAAADAEMEGVRHSARSVRAQRKRLKLSAADFGLLVGVSGLTVYNWEHGKGRPSEANLAALVAVRKLGVRESLAKLEMLRPAKK
jgi:DNA-binding transcriptional regulator YiaG